MGLGGGDRNEEQSHQRSKLGLEASRRHPLTFGVQKGALLLDGVLPGFIESVHYRQRFGALRWD